MRRRQRFALLGSLTLLAYLLRTVSLNVQSFWLDEFYAVWFIDRPFTEALRLIVTPDNNGPLYFLLLWPWHRLTGDSDFAVRYLSTLFSVLTVGTLWQLGRHWFNQRAAAWAALLFTLSPFAIWFSQEAKMYALHMFLTTLSTLLLVRALHKSTVGRWLSYGLSINLVGYSHFFGAFAIAAQGLITLVVTGRRWRKRGAYLLTMLLVALPYLPVIRFALRAFPTLEITDPSKRFVPPGKGLRSLMTAYALRQGSNETPTWILILTGALLIVGLVEAWRRGWRRGLWLTGMLSLPFVLFYAVAFKLRVFDPKYLSAIFPFFVLTSALVIEAVRRVHFAPTLLCVALLVTPLGYTHVRDLTQPDVQRTDWRYVADYLERYARPNDVIVTYVDYVDRLLRRYYDGSADVRPYPYDPATPELLYDELEAEARSNLWLVLHHDRVFAPDHRLVEVAQARYPQITGHYPTLGQIRLLGYNLRWRHSTLPNYVTPQEARFANGLALAGYIVSEDTLPPTEKVAHPPSNWIPVTTYWQRWSEPGTEESHNPVLLLQGPQGGIWGRSLERRPTVFERDPPKDWPEETVIEIHDDVNLNPATPPGTYRLLVTFETEAGEISLGQDESTTQVLLQEIEILPPSTAQR